MEVRHRGKFTRLWQAHGNLLGTLLLFEEKASPLLRMMHNNIGVIEEQEMGLTH